MIEKVISDNLSFKTVKNKLKNATLLIEVETKKQADFLLKMIKFHNISVQTYSLKSLIISYRIVRSKELSFYSRVEQYIPNPLRCCKCLKYWLPWRQM